SNRERIIRKNAGFAWEGAIHELLVFEKPVNGAFADVTITHAKHHEDYTASLIRNANISMKLIDSGKGKLMDYYYLGISLSVLGLHERAIFPLRHFIEHNDRPDFSGTDAFVKLYESYMALGDKESAYLLLSQNEEINKDKSEYYCMLGNFMEAVLKDYKKAAEYYQRALKCEGKERGVYPFLLRNEWCYYYEPLYRLGQCYVKLRELKKAHDAFVKALTYRKNDKELEALAKKISKIMEVMG
ncbi:MAG: hypothetical protein LBU94_05110, partial [Clostridiales bacterium]|nr:hypothetical protein [Clostridiales bacterium]